MHSEWLKNGVKVNQENFVDSQCIFIERDDETEDYVDYFYVSDIRGNDPRYKQRNMVIGQARGLFRINKKTLEPVLLKGIELDLKNRCFHRAAAKILKLYRSDNEFPEKAAFQSG